MLAAPMGQGRARVQRNRSCSGLRSSPADRPGRRRRRRPRRRPRPASRRPCPSGSRRRPRARRRRRVRWPPSTRPSRSHLAAAILDRLEAGDAKGDVHEPAPKGPPVGIGHDHADAAADRRADGAPGSGAPTGPSPLAESTAVPAAVFEVSIPALAQTKPWCVSQMSVAPRRRTIRADSAQDQLAQRGSLPVRSASARARGVGTTSASTTTRSSSLLTIFWATASDVSRTNPLRGRRVGDQLRETPVGPDLRQALEGEQPQRTTPAPRRSARPHAAQHTRRPAAVVAQRQAPGGRRACRRRARATGSRAGTARCPAFDRAYSCSARELAPSRVAMPNGGAIASALVPVPSRDGTSTAPRPGRQRGEDGVQVLRRRRAAGRPSGSGPRRSAGPRPPPDRSRRRGSCRAAGRGPTGRARRPRG